MGVKKEKEPIARHKKVKAKDGAIFVVEIEMYDPKTKTHYYGQIGKRKWYKADDLKVID